MRRLKNVCIKCGASLQLTASLVTLPFCPVGQSHPNYAPHQNLRTSHLEGLVVFISYFLGRGGNLSTA